MVKLSKSSISEKMDWKLNIPIEIWSGVTYHNRRITKLDLYDNMGAEDAKDWFYHLTSRTKPLRQQYRCGGCERTGFTTWGQKLDPTFNKIGSEGQKG